EYNIGVEVLGRPPGFDPSNDAGARVEVHRLRRQLQEYYEHEGAYRKLRIIIPIGHYVPAFVPNPAAPPASLAVEPEPELIPAPAQVEPEEMVARPSEIAPVTVTPETSRFRPKYLGAIGLLTLLVLASGVWELLRASRKSEAAHPASSQHDSAPVGII